MKKVLFMLLVMFALSACQSKDSYVKEFSDFVDKVEMEAADYTDKDWKKADLKFSDLSTNLYAKFDAFKSVSNGVQAVRLIHPDDLDQPDAGTRIILEKQWMRVEQ